MKHDPLNLSWNKELVEDIIQIINMYICSTEMHLSVKYQVLITNILWVTDINVAEREKLWLPHY